MDYEPQPKNAFSFKVNDAEIHSLVKEEVEFDPSQTEKMNVDLKVNGVQAIKGVTPWIISEVDEKIQTTLGIDPLNSLEIDGLNGKSWVANEFLDALTCCDTPDQGLDKLTMHSFRPSLEPFEDEVISGLANMC